MATMIPPSLPDDAPASEQLVFRLLSEDSAAEGWVIMHKVRPLPSRRRQRREIDFLCLVPNAAVLCLEVKGGEFIIQGGAWHRQIGASRESMESPVDQAETAMYLMRNEMVDQFRSQWSEHELPIGCAVVFTDTNWPGGIRPPERPVIGLPELQQQGSKTLAERLAEIARATRNAIHIRTPLRLNPAVIESIQRWLAPDATLSSSARPVPYNREERHLLRFTQEQYQALQTASENARSLFSGGAGTGKTMLALELARQRSAAGDRVALLCYNRILGDWLFGQSLENFALGNLVGSFWHHFAYAVIRQDDAHYAKFAAAMDNAVDNDARYDVICPEYLRDALLENGEMFDYLIVDELQDMCQAPYLDIMDLALRDGLKSGRWAMFADFNQRTMERNANSNIRHLDELAGQYTTYDLATNCRNTLQIVEDSDKVMRIDRTGFNPVNGPLPTYLLWRNEADLRVLLDREVHDLVVGMGENVNEIFVLSINPLSEFAPDLLNYTYDGYPLFDCPGIYWPPRATCDQNPCCQNPNDDYPHLKFRTVRRFKGMENKTIILIVDRLAMENDRRSVYIGLTRARVKLTVLAHESTKDKLASLIGRDPVLPGAVLAEPEVPPAASAQPDSVQTEPL